MKWLMPFVMNVLLLGAICGTAKGEYWFVDDDGQQDSQADFSVIQDAVDAASNGDVIFVWPGTYASTGSVINFKGKRIRIQSNPSLGGAAVTVLQNLGETSAVVYEGNQPGSGRELDGFTIVGGTSGIQTFFSLDVFNCIIQNNQSGIRFNDILGSAEMKVDNCIIRGNIGSFPGAGIDITGGPVDIVNCEIYDNIALGTNRGGGIHIGGTSSIVTMTGCRIRNNNAGAGGGLNIQGNNSVITIEDCEVKWNIAQSQDGGGIRNNSNGELSITNSTICENLPQNTYGSVPLDESNCVSESCNDQDEDDIIDACDTDTFHVPDDFPTIQEAIDHASDTDTIVVSAGTYTGTGDSVIDTKGKAITILGEQGNGDVVLDGEHQRRVVVCTNGEDEHTIIKGFRITNGYSAAGSGIYCHSSSPLVSDCIITGNDAVSSASGALYGGGGVYGYNSSLNLSNCLITNNSCDYMTGSGGGGGGICFSFNLFDQASPRIENCSIQLNSGVDVGGIQVSQDSHLTIVNSDIQNNTGTGIKASASTVSLEGCDISGQEAGGVSIHAWGIESPTDIIDCTIQHNGNGRGLHLENVISGRIESCLIANHNASSMNDGGYGGGLRILHSGSISLKDCIFRDNTALSGGGLSAGSESISLIENCTFTGNRAEGTDFWTGNGGGLAFGGGKLINCIVSNNTASQGGAGLISGGDLELINCTIESNQVEDFDYQPAIKCWTGDVIVTDCTLSGNESLKAGPTDLAIRNTYTFTGVNSIEGPVRVWSGVMLLDSTTQTTVGEVVPMWSAADDVNLQFDLDLPDGNTPLISNDTIASGGSLSIQNSSNSLQEAAIGDLYPLIQADVASTNFGSIVFPALPAGRGLQIIEQNQRGDSRAVEIAAEVIEVDTPDFGNPLSGDLDAVPLELRSGDVDGDDRDELIVLFDGTPGFIVVYDIQENGPPVERTFLTISVGDTPVDMAVADIDLDGDDDVLVANQGSSTISVLNSTPGAFTQMTIPVTFGTLTCVSGTNWNGNSQLDAVIGLDIPGTSKDEFRLILDLMSGGSTGPIFTIPNAEIDDNLYTDAPTTVEGSDRNGWGFVGGTEKGRVLRAQPGSTTLTAVLSLEDNNSSISAIVVEDLDDDGGDGLLDVVAASADRGFLYLFEGQTTGLSSSIPVNVQLPVEDLTALDADDDADVDFIMVAPSSVTEPMVLLRNDGTTTRLRGLAGRTWSKQTLATNTTPTSIASGNLEPKDEEDDWVIASGMSAGLRGSQGKIEQTVINLIAPDCAADINGDGVVNMNDLLIVLDHFGSSGEGDVDGDGIIGLQDILVLLASYGSQC